MDSTATFYVNKDLPVDNDTFLSLYLKPARAMKLCGQIVAQGGFRYHFRIDGPSEALKEFIAYAAIGGPAFGTVRGLYLWIGDELYTEEEALAQTLRPFEVKAPRKPADDHVVPEHNV